MTYLSEEEKWKLFHKCYNLAIAFAAEHQSGIALKYLGARREISDAGLDEEFKAWFFDEKSHAEYEKQTEGGDGELCLKKE